jgi:acyl-[acyl-carrier-protein]-phospholipid O-acyltransferase/long-chain-fatty-acid--[acyl-carrier-protein] ligase
LYDVSNLLLLCGMKKILQQLFAVAMRRMVRGIGWILFRFEIAGSERIPKEGGALVVANHLSYVDFILLVCAIPRPVHFIMNGDVFRKPLLRPFLKALNCIPVSSGQKKGDYEAFNAAVKTQVEAGHMVAIFAEGTVSRTGQLLEFKKGIEHLSKQVNAPIIPVHFHQVIGSPFTFRAGKSKMIRFEKKSVRRKIRVLIGLPLDGPVSAFSLRQHMKEMEAAHANRAIGADDRLDRRIMRVLSEKPQGEWRSGSEVIDFSSLPELLEKWDAALVLPLKFHRTVAVLAPKSIDTMLLHLYLLKRGVAVLHLRPDMSNEERFAACKKANVRLLITTSDIAYTKVAPVTDEVLYLEEIKKAMEGNVSAISICKKARREVMSWFAPARNSEEAVVVYTSESVGGPSEGLTVLTHRRLLAAIEGLRQVYYFKRGTTLLADLEMHDAFGYVLEFLVPLWCDLKLELFPDETKADQFAQQLETRQGSLVFATPTQLEAIAAHAERRNMPHLNTLFTAAVHPSHHAVSALLERGIQVFTCAGLNSTAGVFAVNVQNYEGRDIVGKKLDQEAFEAGSVGKPLPGCAVRIVAQNGEECGVDEVGNIWVYGPAIAHSGADSRALVWVETRLKGFLNHRGFLFLNQD